MSNFGTGISPWVNGIPPCFVSQPTYVPPAVGFQNWGQSGIVDARVDSGQMFSSSKSGASDKSNLSKKRALQHGSPSGIAKKFRTELLKVTIPGEGRVGRTVNNSRGGINAGNRGAHDFPPYHCIVCDKYFKLEASYRQHSTSPGHMSKQQAKEKVAAKKKVDPAKTIAGNAAQPSSRHQFGNVDKNQLSQAAPKRIRFCWQCNVKFGCSLIEHRQTEEHKKVELKDPQFCAECEKYFATPQTLAQHCRDKKHKNSHTSVAPAPLAAPFVNKHTRHIRTLIRRRAQNVVDVEADFRSGFTTVDAIGYDDEENDKQIEDLSVVDDDDDDDRVTADATSVTRENSKGDDCMDNLPEEQTRPSIATSATKTAAAAAAAAGRKLSGQSVMSEPEVAAAAVSSLPLKKSGPNAGQVADVAEMSRTDLAKPTVGANFIVPISGFYCKICHKLFLDEAIARISHCQSEGHYSRYMALQAVLLHKAPIKMEPLAKRKTETNQKINTTAKEAPEKDVEDPVNEATIVSKAADKEATNNNQASSNESMAGVVDSANKNNAAAKDNTDNSAAEKYVTNKSIATEEDPTIGLHASKDASTDDVNDKIDASTEGMIDGKEASTEDVATAKDTTNESATAEEDVVEESAAIEKDSIDVGLLTTKDTASESVASEIDSTNDISAAQIDKANTDG